MDTGSALLVAGLACILIGGYIRYPRLLAIDFRESFKQRVEACRVYEQTLTLNKLRIAKTLLIVGWGLLTLGYLLLGKVFMFALMIFSILGLIYLQIKNKL
jgi:hypothetical protein